jgi:hypothetical protein
MTMRRTSIVGAALLLLSLACFGSWWLLGRMSVGTYRHALNHPEAGKDTLVSEIRAGCGEVSRRFWVNADDQRYVADPRAHSNEVYRYIVLDGALLAAPPCMSRIVRAAGDVRYPVQVVFTRDGREVANFYFKNAAAREQRN